MCELVTGVQTCALPIFLRCEEVNAVLKLVGAHHAVADRVGLTLGGIPEHDRRRDIGLEPHPAAPVGSEARRVGKARVSTCRSRCSPSQYKKIATLQTRMSATTDSSPTITQHVNL